jgi:hypothetical protein
VKRPETFTITTFWMDWLLQPIVLAAVWLTVRWALADASQASALGTWGAIPAWGVSVPLLVTAAGWLIIGFGMLVKEEYWEFRFISSGLIIWALCCLMGAALILLGFLRGGSGFGVAGILNFVGLLMMSLTIVLPAWVDHSPTDKVIRFARIWFVLLTACVGCLTAGMVLGFPYNFPRFPLGIGAFFFLGLGLTEITFRKASFPWLLRLFQPRAGGREYHDDFPESAAWRIEGIVRMLVGIGAAAILVIG